MDDLTSACEFLTDLWELQIHITAPSVRVSKLNFLTDYADYPKTQPNALREAILTTARKYGWKPPPNTTLAMGLYVREEMEEAFARGWYAALRASVPITRPDTGLPDFSTGPVDYTDLKEILCPEKQE